MQGWGIILYNDTAEHVLIFLSSSYSLLFFFFFGMTAFHGTTFFDAGTKQFAMVTKMAGEENKDKIRLQELLGLPYTLDTDCLHTN